MCGSLPSCFILQSRMAQFAFIVPLTHRQMECRMSCETTHGRVAFVRAFATWLAFSRPLGAMFWISVLPCAVVENLPGPSIEAVSTVTPIRMLSLETYFCRVSMCPRPFNRHRMAVSFVMRCWICVIMCSSCMDLVNTMIRSAASLHSSGFEMFTLRVTSSSTFLR